MVTWTFIAAQPDERIGIKGIPNARLEKDLATLAILRDADAAETAGEIRHRLEQNVEQGIPPQALIDLEQEDLGFTVSLSWAGCRSDGSYDAMFVPAPSLQGPPLPAIGWPEPDAAGFVHFANAPGQSKFRNQLIDQRAVKPKRYKEMTPQDIVLVDTVVRTSGGGVDSSALLVAKNASSLP